MRCHRPSWNYIMIAPGRMLRVNFNRSIGYKWTGHWRGKVFAEVAGGWPAAIGLLLHIAKGKPSIELMALRPRGDNDDCHRLWTHLTNVLVLGTVRRRRRCDCFTSFTEGAATEQNIANNRGNNTKRVFHSFMRGERNKITESICHRRSGRERSFTHSERSGRILGSSRVSQSVIQADGHTEALSQWVSKPVRRRTVKVQKLNMDFALRKQFAS